MDNLSWWRKLIPNYTPETWWQECLPGFTAGAFPAEGCTEDEGDLRFHSKVFRVIVRDIRFEHQIEVLPARPYTRINDECEGRIAYEWEPTIEKDAPFFEDASSSTLYGPHIVLGWRILDPKETCLSLLAGFTKKGFPAEECTAIYPHQEGVFDHPHIFYGATQFKKDPEVLTLRYVRPFVVTKGNKGQGWGSANSDENFYSPQTRFTGPYAEVMHAWRRIEFVTRLQMRRAA